MTIRRQTFFRVAERNQPKSLYEKSCPNTFPAHYIILQTKYSVAADMVVGAPELLVY